MGPTGPRRPWRGLGVLNKEIPLTSVADSGSQKSAKIKENLYKNQPKLQENHIVLKKYITRLFIAHK